MPHTYGDDDVDNDEKYHESSDEDFNPEEAPVEQASSSEDEDHVTIEPTQRKGKRKAPADEDLDSGDEVTIQAARKKRARKKKKGSKEDEELVLSDDEGGEGGLIKTRAQRKVEGKERRPLARTEGATVDVDALWAQMTAAPLKPVRSILSREPDAPKDHAPVINIPAAVEEEEQLAVKKVYTFAGQDTTEEKQVPRSQLDKYLKDGWKTLDAHPQQPPRKPRPNPKKKPTPPSSAVPSASPRASTPTPRATSALSPPNTSSHGPEHPSLRRSKTSPPTQISPQRKRSPRKRRNSMWWTSHAWTGLAL
jgi:hypothetical protein